MSVDSATPARYSCTRPFLIVARDPFDYLRNWAACVDRVLGGGAGSPLPVAFQPLESKKTVYEWGWISNDPATQGGRQELAQFLMEDIRGASLVYSPGGAENFAGASKPDRVLGAAERARGQVSVLPAEIR
jgi:hypothetical protein